MSVDYTAITAVTAIVAAITAITAIIIQDRRSRVTHAIDLLLRLSQEFNSDRFLKYRREVAEFHGWAIPDTQKLPDIGVAEANILDHFQLVAQLARKRAIDWKMVSDEYWAWLSPYYSLLHGKIVLNRADYPDVWEDATWLFHKLARRQTLQGLRRQEAPASELRADLQWLLSKLRNTDIDRLSQRDDWFASSESLYEFCEYEASLLTRDEEAAGGTRRPTTR